MKHKFHKAAAATAAQLFHPRSSQAATQSHSPARPGYQELHVGHFSAFILKKSRMDPVTVLLSRKLFYHKQRTDTGWSRRLKQAK